jgi:hypothetical protein
MLVLFMNTTAVAKRVPNIQFSVGVFMNLSPVIKTVLPAGSTNKGVIDLTLNRSM